MSVRQPRPKTEGPRKANQAVLADSFPRLGAKTPLKSIVVLFMPIVLPVGLAEGLQRRHKKAEDGRVTARSSASPLVCALRDLLHGHLWCHIKLSSLHIIFECRWSSGRCAHLATQDALTLQLLSPPELHPCPRPTPRSIYISFTWTKLYGIINYMLYLGRWCLVAFSFLVEPFSNVSSTPSIFHFFSLSSSPLLHLFSLLLPSNYNVLLFFSRY